MSISKAGYYEIKLEVLLERYDLEHAEAMMNELLEAIDAYNGVRQVLFGADFIEADRAISKYHIEAPWELSETYADEIFNCGLCYASIEPSMRLVVASLGEGTEIYYCSYECAAKEGYE